MENFGIRLKKLREELRYYQDDFANILGVTQNTISKYETGSRSPNVKFLQKLVEVSNVNLHWLIKGSGPMFDEEFKIRDIYPGIPDDPEKENYWTDCRIEQSGSPY